MAGSAPFASVLGGLITLLAVSCLMLAIWRLTSDVGWTNSFIISDGFLSHWQVWMALTVGFGAIAVRLTRYGHSLEQTMEQAAGEVKEEPAGKGASR